MHLAHHDAAAGPLSWVRLLVVLLARAYRTVLISLTVVALAPVVSSLHSYVVESGSMRPSISIGDVVVARPASPDDRVQVGRVYVFAAPDDAERLMVHRIVERRDDGDYTTAGDANDVTDLAALQASAIRAQAVLLVPYVGLPVHWLHTGRWMPLTVWLLLTVAAFVLAARRLDEDRPSRRGGWFRRLRHGSASGPTPRPRRSPVPVAASTALLVLVPVLTTGSASAGFTARTTTGSNEWTVGSWVQRYVGAVLTDRPFGLWLLDETVGSGYAQDRSGNNRTGQYLDELTLGRPGGLPTNPGTSVAVTGGRVVLGAQLVSAPAAYSIELWFRTTSSAGGYLAGFEDDRDDNWRGGQADRLVHLTASGSLTFGVWSNRTTAITTPRAYNDGDWHHLVVTSTATRASTVYVDGVAVTSGTTSTVDGYLGHWRVGQGSTGNQNGFSSSFPGDIDNVSIFHSVLSPARVAAHWAAR